MMLNFYERCFLPFGASRLASFLHGSLIVLYGFPLQAPILSAFLYDATYLYAIGVNRTLAEGGNVKDGRTIMKNLFGRKFSSKWRRTEEFAFGNHVLIKRACFQPVYEF